MADLRSLFALSRSAVVQAGAGTGKTHSLVTLCLHLLAGVGRDEPLSPSRLWAVTFTEKAAAELKGRIRQRVDRLAELRSADELARAEPELHQAFLERAALPASHWRRVRRDLGLAQVGTIHGLCGQILRRHAAVAGIDPGFAVLDEVQTRSLLNDACERTALDALDGRLGEEQREAARRLCVEMGFKGPGRFGRGLADELRVLLVALGESGRSVSEVVEGTRGLVLGAALEASASARDGLRAAARDLEQAARVSLARRASDGARRALETALEFERSGAAAVALAPPGELVRAASALAGFARRGNGAGPLAEAVSRANDACEVLLEADAQVRACHLSRQLALVAGEALTRYRDAKARASSVDFDDLTRLVRDLLARNPRVRKAEKERLGVLLIDEFQDTSRTQLELFGWLVEGAGASGAAPAGSGLQGALPVAPGVLVVVGDRKQSIYEFRGADVGGAQAFAAAALRDGAELHLLRQSRRSRPALVAFANLLFADALSAKSEPFDTPFKADEDALAAHRPAGDAGACAELLDVTGPGVDAEAAVVARRIAALLAPGAPERVLEAGPDGVEIARPVRGGDIALLLRRFTNVESFRRALLARRIPHLVLKGRGFFEAREVMDLLALLSVAADPGDALALATVLRSPLGPVSDDGLVLLARGPRSTGAPGRGLSRSALRDPATCAALASDDADAVARLELLLSQLEREIDRLGPAALLEGVLAETDYVAALAGGLHGEQAAANVDKLVARARAHELQGGSVRSFLAHIEELVDEDVGEPDAAVVEEKDPHAVRLLTVHAAKGLEFPMVFVPECAVASKPQLPGNTQLEPDLGLALKVRGADGQRRWGAPGKALRERRYQREIAQSRRLLYVAATRARDLLVLSGRQAAPSECWRTFLDRAAAQAVPAGLLRVLRDGAPDVASPSRGVAATTRAPDSAAAGRPEAAATRAPDVAAAGRPEAAATRAPDSAAAGRPEAAATRAPEVAAAGVLQGAAGGSPESPARRALHLVRDEPHETRAVRALHIGHGAFPEEGPALRAPGGTRGGPGTDIASGSGELPPGIAAHRGDPAPKEGPLCDRVPGLLAALTGLAKAGEPEASAPPQPEGPLGAALEDAAGLVRRASMPAGGAQATVSAAVTQIADASACARRYQLLHEARLEERPVREPQRDPLTELHEATSLGTLAHKLLELSPLGPMTDAARRDALRAILALEGADPADTEIGEVLDAAARFLSSPLGERLGRAPPDRVNRELPFVLRLAPTQDEPPGPTLLLRGQIDALLLDDGAATVLDYKLSRARDPEAYAVQLDAYALAVGALVEGALPVRTGLVFLRSGGRYVERPAATPQRLDRIRAQLLDAARAIADGRRTGRWPKVVPARCKELECGFLWRCHPEERPQPDARAQSDGNALGEEVRA